MNELMENDLISIIIPIYNVEEYIEECLESIQKQTYTNIEVILVDDGSMDNSVAIAQRKFLDDDRFKLIHQENAGLSAARNRGIKEAQGEYIVLVDSDDKVTSDYIEYLYAMIRKYNVKIATCAHQSLPRKQKPKKIVDPRTYTISTKEYFKKLGDKELPFQLGVAAWGRIYKKELFTNINYPEGKLFEDTATTYKLYLEAGTTAIGEEIKYLYCQNENSIVQKGFNKTRFQFLDNEKKMHDDLKAIYPDIEKSLDRRYQYALMNTLAHIVISPNNMEFKSEQIKLKNDTLKGFGEKIFDKKNNKKDIFGLISLRLGLPFYRMSFKVFKKMKKRGLGE